MAAVVAPATNTAIPQTPVSEISVYYDANSAEGAHDVHAHPNPSSDTITQKHEQTSAGASISDSNGADVQRKPSVAAGALEDSPTSDLQPREPAAGGILASKAKTEEKQLDVSVRDSGFAQTNDKSVAFTPTTQVHDQPSPAYESTPGSNALTDIKAPPKASTILSEQEKAGSVDDNKPLTDNATSVQRTSTGAFAKGAAVTGPEAKPAEVAGQHERAATAESQLTEKQKAKLTKQESEYCPLYPHCPEPSTNYISFV